MLTSKPAKVGKVVICGMKGVGKTAILEQLIYGHITPDSVGIFFFCKFLFDNFTTIYAYNMFIAQMILLFGGHFTPGLCIFGHRSG